MQATSSFARCAGRFARHCVVIRHMSSGEIRAADASFTGGRSRSCGIVGMPNVGKSTLFNALTNTQKAEAANYPFCTIEPNVGRVAVPDTRLETLAKLAGSKKTVGSQLEFVDIAGLVRGASEGAGLGNKFLANIREVSTIVQLLRCFDDTEETIIEHVDGSVDPVRDLDTIETELMLADIQTLSKHTTKNKRVAAKAPAEAALVEKVMAQLDAGKPARDLMLKEEEVKAFRELRLLSAKPLLLVCNVSESGLAGNVHVKKLEEHLKATREEGAVELITVCSTLEAELSTMGGDEESKTEMLQEYGLDDTGLSRVIAASNQLLGLGTFYTVGPQEARAWPFPKGYTAPQAAAIIHTDMERGFIRAETIAYDDYVALGGEAQCKAAGKLRLEGKEYVCQDGDVYMFRFNV